MTTYLKYQVVHGFSISELEKKVAVFIAQGWKPLGGVATATDNSHWEFYQAMTIEVQVPVHPPKPSAAQLEQFAALSKAIPTKAG
jgi:hypothetical protein